MAYETLLCDKTAGVLTVTFNRPDRYNALTETMHREIGAAFKDAAADADVRAVILTGAGKAFCSGQDLKEIKDMPGRNLGDSLRNLYNPNILRIRRLEKPVICALNGVAAGAGMSFALACDLIIAGESATMIQSFINIGLVPDSGSMWFLTRLVGYYKAFEIASTGGKLAASQLQELGLVQGVVPDAELATRARALAAQYAVAPTKGIGLLKRGLNRMFTADLEQALEYEAHLQEIAGASDDYREGVAAFNEKRAAQFQGK